LYFSGEGRQVYITDLDQGRNNQAYDKVKEYEYVKSYGCDYFTAANDFALTKKLYEQQTGFGERNGGIGGLEEVALLLRPAGLGSA
jgi:hypothetical protein